MEQGPFGMLIVAEVVLKILASYGTCRLIIVGDLRFSPVILLKISLTGFYTVPTGK
jgi:hypothetical protein